jgi:hypothetical protein
MTEISKEEFLSVYNKYPPNKWVKFAYKHFSKESENKPWSIQTWVLSVLLGSYLIGFIAVAFDMPIEYALIPTEIYTGTLFTIVTYLFSAVFLNNRRIKKIYKELGITEYEYYKLVKMYL